MGFPSTGVWQPSPQITSCWCCGRLPDCPLTDLIGDQNMTQSKGHKQINIIGTLKGPQCTHRITLHDNPDPQVLALTAHSLRLMPNCFTSSTSFSSPKPFCEVGTTGLPILPMRKLSLGRVIDDLLTITERVSDSAC